MARRRTDDGAQLIRGNLQLRLPSRVGDRIGDRSLMCMIPVEFTRDELALIHHALSAFLSDFGHKEQDVVHRLQELLGKIPTPA
jgi:hypothetical protein